MRCIKTEALIDSLKKTIEKIEKEREQHDASTDLLIGVYGGIIEYIERFASEPENVVHID